MGRVPDEAHQPQTLVRAVSSYEKDLNHCTRCQASVSLNVIFSLSMPHLTVYENHSNGLQIRISFQLTMAARFLSTPSYVRTIRPTWGPVGHLHRGPDQNTSRGVCPAIQGKYRPASSGAKSSAFEHHPPGGSLFLPCPSSPTTRASSGGKCVGLPYSHNFRSLSSFFPTHQIPFTNSHTKHTKSHFPCPLPPHTHH